MPIRCIPITRSTRAQSGYGGDEYLPGMLVYRKVRCLKCPASVMAEQLCFCDAGKRVTHRLAQYIFELCKILTVQKVSEHLAIDKKTVKAIGLAGLEAAHGQN